MRIAKLQTRGLCIEIFEIDFISKNSIKTWLITVLLIYKTTLFLIKSNNFLIPIFEGQNNFIV